MQTAMVLVKGTVAQAMQSAMIRGYEPHNFKQHRPNECIGEISARDLSKLGEWMNDSGNPKLGVGYATGTLLLFRYLQRSMVG